MACRIDEFNNAAQLEAAKHHIALLKILGEWDATKNEHARLLGVVHGDYFRMTLGEIKMLCGKIRELGGTDYLKTELEKRVTPEIAGVYGWWTEYERKDIAAHDAQNRRAATDTLFQAGESLSDKTPSGCSVQNACSEKSDDASVSGDAVRPTLVGWHRNPRTRGRSRKPLTEQIMLDYSRS